MKNFANVPIESVFKTLGIQMKQSRKTEVLEFKSFSCSGCDKKTLIGDFVCNSCPYKPQSIKVKGYADMFDPKYSKTLKSAAIKLYIALFFYCDSDGCGDSVSFKELADLIDVNVKTIKASLDALSKENYIIYDQENPRYFGFDIVDYREMYKKAFENGKGYVTLDQSILSDLMSVKDLNSLRCIIKIYFNASYNQYRSASKIAATKVSFAELRKSLPSYVKPFILRKAINDVGKFFENFRENYKEYVVVLGEKYQRQVIKERLKADGKVRIPDYIKKINDMISSANADVENNGAISFATNNKFFADGLILPPVAGKIPEIRFNSDQRNDLVNLCPEYGIENIINAIKTYFVEYILNRVKINNPGGLIRKILMEQTEYNFISSEA